MVGDTDTSARRQQSAPTASAFPVEHRPSKATPLTRNTRINIDDFEQAWHAREAARNAACNRSHVSAAGSAPACPRRRRPACSLSTASRPAAMRTELTLTSVVSMAVEVENGRVARLLDVTDETRTLEGSTGRSASRASACHLGA
jgi:hypothetical protein